MSEYKKGGFYGKKKDSYYRLQEHQDVSCVRDISRDIHNKHLEGFIK
jgi:hypothetical protein